jgi:hypothetical protein
MSPAGSVLLLLLALGPSAPTMPLAKPTAASLFEQELLRRGLGFERGSEAGLYKVRVGGVDLDVSLANVARNYERDGDPEGVLQFAQHVAEFRPEDDPPWEKAKPFLVWVAEPSNQDFGTTVRDPVTKQVVRVLVRTDEAVKKLSWVTAATVAAWGVPEKEVRSAADANLSRVLQGTRIEILDVKGMKLGMIPVPSALKASVIFAPDFKRLVSRELGWPVLVVIPCRDFLYVWAEKDRGLLDRVGGVVQEEYRKSGYPITTEVLRISDEGIKAIGRFPE